jgi:hypothetical protein
MGEGQSREKPRRFRRLRGGADERELGCERDVVRRARTETMEEGVQHGDQVRRKAARRARDQCPREDVPRPRTTW